MNPVIGDDSTFTIMEETALSLTPSHTFTLDPIFIPLPYIYNHGQT